MNKRVLAALALPCLLAMPSQAQEAFPTLSPEQMQQMQAHMPPGFAEMMQTLQAYMGCMQSELGPEGMQTIQKFGEEMGTKINELCSQGRKADALEYAKSAGKKFENHPFGKASQACHDKHLKDVDFEALAGDMAKNIPQVETDYDETDICG